MQFDFYFVIIIIAQVFCVMQFYTIIRYLLSITHAACCIGGGAGFGSVSDTVGMTLAHAM